MKKRKGVAEWLLDNLIGGETGKRETAFGAVLFWTAGVCLISIYETSTTLVFAKEMLRFSAPFVWGWMGIAFGLDWVSKQTNITETKDNKKEPEWKEGKP